MVVLVLVLFSTLASALDLSAFSSASYLVDHDAKLHADVKHSFYIGLKKQKTHEEMEALFLAISTPSSPKYGKYYSYERVQEEIAPTAATKSIVSAWLLEQSGNQLQIDDSGDFVKVHGSIGVIEKVFSTKLSQFKHVSSSSAQGALRASSSLRISNDEVASKITFLSLNAPINRGKAQALSSSSSSSSSSSAAAAASATSFNATTVYVTSGNEEALVRFTPTCGDGKLNSFSPPCSNLPASQVPVFTANVFSFNNNASDAFPLEQDYKFNLFSSLIYCYNSKTSVECAGSGSDQVNCVCITKLSPLPKYTQLRATIESTINVGVDNTTVTSFVGLSTLFALTDVATPAFLKSLYGIPQALTVRHGSNQSMAEFYGEFYSNADLASFLSLVGYPFAELPVENVYGNNPNIQSEPGGEAQLDVEVIMSIARNASTFFYSYSNLSQFDSANEGFLAWLDTVSTQPFPPLVFSLSYGDIEATVFNASNPGSIAYGQACDQQFMLMGVRGLTVLVSSGDDGIGSQIVRTDKELGCSQAWPEWPASSPYITAVGATQTTNKYTPGCGKPYALNNVTRSLPPNQNLLFECSGFGETVCTSTMGGVITSGTMFSRTHMLVCTHSQHEHTLTHTYSHTRSLTHSHSHT